MRRRAFGALAALATAAVACNALLGIEEKGAKPDIADGGDAGVIDRPDAPLATDKCTTDSDCVPPNGCYTPHCNTTLGACAYALCEAPGRACAVGACDPAKLTCGDPRDYAMRTTSYSVTGIALGCRKAGLCVAAAFPYLFLGTRNDVVALRVDDLLATSASVVPIGQVIIRPSQLVPSGRRVWILGDPQGTAPPYQLPVAWIDVPSDPTAPALPGKTVFLSYPFPNAVGFAAPDGGLFVVYDDVAQGFPATRLVPPLESGATMAVVNPEDAGAPSPPPAIPLVRVSAPPAASDVIASSGGRLVVYRPPGIVNVVDMAGVAGAALSGDATLAPAYASFGPPQFASEPSGAVVMTTSIVADGDCNCTSHQRMHWLLPNAVSGNEPNEAVDYEGYVGPQIANAACHACNPSYMTFAGSIAAVDKATALAASPASENRDFTAVRAITRDPIALPAKRRFVTTAADDPQGNFATDRVAIASSNGLGYLVMSDSQGNKVTVSIVDPRCDAK
jgi:hypothetical protein